MNVVSKHILNWPNHQKLRSREWQIVVRGMLDLRCSVDHVPNQGAALTLNYNLADACIALAADALGRKADAQMLRERSKSFRPALW